MTDTDDKNPLFQVGHRCGYLEAKIHSVCERLMGEQFKDPEFHLSGTYQNDKEALDQLFREYREITAQHPLQEELDIMERYLRATRRFNGVITREQGELLSRDRRALLEQFL